MNTLDTKYMMSHTISHWLVSRHTGLLGNFLCLKFAVDSGLHRNVGITSWYICYLSGLGHVSTYKQLLALFMIPGIDIALVTVCYLPLSDVHRNNCLTFLILLIEELY